MRIFKVFILMVAFLFTFQSGHAQVVLNPKFHMFGKVVPGKHYDFSVKITNPTNQTLSLWNLVRDCECTDVHIDQAVLKPKAFTTLHVHYHPLPGENGFKHFEVTFQVYSQDKNKKMLKNTQKFMFSAEIHSPYVLDPATLNGGFVMAGATTQTHGSLILNSKAYPDWEPGMAEVIPGPFKADVKPASTPGSYQVSFSIPENTKPGRYVGNIKIIGKEKADEEFDYPFVAEVGSLWNVTPALLDLGILDPANFKNWAGDTQIRQIYDKPFKILKIEGLPSWLKYRIGKEDKAFCGLIWEVDLEGLKKAKGETIPASFVIQTDSKKESSITVPLKGSWAIPKAMPTTGPGPKVSTTPVSNHVQPTPIGKPK